MATVSTPNGFSLDNAGRRVVVDPVTRIEGHMRVEVNLDGDNVIRNAVSTGTMWRGLEVILKGRDPRDAWAFTERICGVCTGTHALTSVRAVEDALDIKIPENANTIRNIMQLTLQVHDHLVHFYHLHALDWVDIVSGLKADAKATSELAQSISSWGKSSPGYFRDIQARLRKFVESGQLGPFKNAYWGHEAYKLPPEANLMATAHYLEALDFQKEIVKIHTVYGGKNPHPNWLVGGVPCPINIDGNGGVGGHGLERGTDRLDGAAGVVLGFVEVEGGRLLLVVLLGRGRDLAGDLAGKQDGGCPGDDREPDIAGQKLEIVVAHLRQHAGELVAGTAAPASRAGPSGR